jgi:uncharacterized protein (DUF2336 family)
MASIVEQFIHWAGNAPPRRRADAARALARAYLISPLSDAEREQAEAVMTVLLDDAAADVRHALAEALAPSELAPHHIILALASDKPVIAAIVAEHSPVILDSELVDMVGRNDETIQLAVARRPFVSRALSAALSEVGSAAACLVLVTNAGARMARFSLDRIIERHGDHPELRRTLLERGDLPIDVHHLLLGSLAASLRNLVVDRGWLRSDHADAVARDARERATIAAAFEAPAEGLPTLVEQLLENGELTPAFVIRAAASGQAMLFETALAALAKVPHARVRALVASGRTGGMQAILRKAGLPPYTLPAFLAAVDVIRNGDPAPGASSDYRRATHLIDAIIHRYRQRPDGELDNILALLRRFATEAKRAAARDYVQGYLEAA